MKPCVLVLLFFTCFVSSKHEAVAQRNQSRPVARLITAPLTSASSRARRVDYEATLPSEPIESSEPSSTAAGAIEKRVFELINSVRQQNGLAPLTWDSELYRMARAHSKNMATRAFFSHVTPDGLSVRDRAQQAGLVSFRKIAENIAYNRGYDDPGAFAVDRWMVSSGHRENILGKEYRSSAIGVFVNAEGAVFLTQVFMLR